MDLGGDGALQPVATHCNGVRRDGQPCTNTILLSSGYCHMHDADHQAGLHAVRVAGGRGRSTASRSAKHLPPELRTVQTALLELVDQVRTGKATPAEATAVATLCGRLVDLARFSIETGEQAALEARLAALEQRAEEGRPRWRQQP